MSALLPFSLTSIGYASFYRCIAFPTRPLEILRFYTFAAGNLSDRWEIVPDNRLQWWIAWNSIKIISVRKSRKFILVASFSWAKCEMWLRRKSNLETLKLVDISYTVRETFNVHKYFKISKVSLFFEDRVQLLSILRLLTKDSKIPETIPNNDIAILQAHATMLFELIAKVYFLKSIATLYKYILNKLTDFYGYQSCYFSEELRVTRVFVGDR